MSKTTLTCQIHQKYPSIECPNPILEGDADDYCILHSRNKDKDETVFREAVRARWEREDSAYHDFRRVWFSIDFGAQKITKSIDFSGANFNSKAIFAEATFTERVDFTDATFKGEAIFFEATFSRKANFVSATFSDEANFVRATFTETVFSKATFEKGANFYGATFKGADFSGANFEMLAHFYEATFKVWAIFSGANFKVVASFSKATFEEGASFSGANFEKGASFSGATFKVWASFLGATFEKGADFIRATFEGWADFWGAKIAGLLLFWDINPRMEGEPQPPWMGVFNELKFQDQGLLRFQDLSLAHVHFTGTDLRLPQFHHVSWHAYRGRQAIYDEILLRQEEKNIPWFQNWLLCHVPPWGDKYGEAERLYRNLKMNYEESGDFKNAGDFHYGEMEMHRRASKWRWFPFYWYNLYWALSGYGERPTRALSWLAIFLAVLTGLLAWAGLQIIDHKYSATFGNSFFYLLQKVTLQRPTWAEPVGFGGKLIAGFSVLLIPGQAALFLLALRNRLGRRG